MHGKTLVNLSRDTEAIAVPDGDIVTLPQGQLVRVLQELGESYTVMNPTGARFRIEGKDADAIGRNPPKLDKIDEADADRSAAGVEKAIWEQLRKVYDPEIPFNIVDIGLIYHVKLDSITERSHRAWIQMTLTAPGCGIGDVLVNDVYSRVSKVPGVKEVDVEMTFDPPWDFSKMSPAVRMQMNL